MSVLQVRHHGGPDGPEFEVLIPGSQAAPKVRLPSPAERRVVDGGPALPKELRWYLEDYLGYPFSPEKERAERLVDALRKWGRDAFDALFSSRQAIQFLDRATAQGYEQLRLQIWSDDPAILAWPWEALRDAQASYLAVTCQIERCLHRVALPVPLAGPPQNQVNILLVTARP